MPDENSPPTPPSPPAATSASGAKPASAAPPSTTDFAHMPMTEEFDRAKWTLPPVIPVLIGVTVLAIAVAIVLFATKAKTITNAAIVQVRVAPQGDNILVAVQVKFDNTTGKQLWTKEVTSELETADGQKYTDQPAPRSDLDRYIRAFPQLADANAAPLGDEQKIATGPFTGVSIFSYPVDKATFDARKSLSLRIKFYDWPALALKQ
jgi:hypothetical protein